MSWGDELTRWCVEHPWQWALYPFGMSILLGFRIGKPIVGVVVGILLFSITRWSFSRGWGRRRYERRRPPPSN